MNTEMESGTAYVIFKDRETAERAYEFLVSRGYTGDDVNLLMSDETRNNWFGDETGNPNTEFGTKALEGAGAGSAIGGTIGAIIGGIAAIGTNVVLPGLGLVVAGPLAAALAGAGAGGLTGGVVGALVGSGIPEHQAVQYEQDIRAGGILMGVTFRSHEELAGFKNEFGNATVLSSRGAGQSDISYPDEENYVTAHKYSERLPGAQADRGGGNSGIGYEDD